MHSTYGRSSSLSASNVSASPTTNSSTNTTPAISHTLSSPTSNDITLANHDYEYPAISHQEPTSSNPSPALSHHDNEFDSPSPLIPAIYAPSHILLPFKLPSHISLYLLLPPLCQKCILKSQNCHSMQTRAKNAIDQPRLNSTLPLTHLANLQYFIIVSSNLCLDL